MNSWKVRAMRLVVAVSAASLAVLAPMMAAATGGGGPVAQGVLGSGAAETQLAMHKLDALYLFSPGCQQVAPPGTTQWLDFSCLSPDPAGTFASENYAHDQVHQASALNSDIGIKQLCDRGQPGVALVDFARSARGPQPTDCEGLRFVQFGTNVSGPAFNAYNVYCTARCAGGASSPQTVSYVGEDGWICKPVASHQTTNPATGHDYRADIAAALTAGGVAPLPSGATGGGSPSTNFCRLSSSPSLPAAAALPAMSNGAYGGYVTASTIKNKGTQPAGIRIAYFDQTGAPAGIGDAVADLPVNASWTVRQDNGRSFPGGGAGSAVVFSNQPIAAFVNEFAPGNVGDATSYTSVPLPSGVGTTLYAPTIVNNAYGGYTTGIGLLNAGTAPTNVTITYRDGGGGLAATQTVSNLAANAYSALYSADTSAGGPQPPLPSGFAGTATITSSGQPLGAIVNETGPGGQFSSYDTVPSGSGLLNAPVALNNAFGGYNTGMGIQNTSGTAGTVTVTYYDGAGNPTPRNFNVAANGSVGVYQGSATAGTPAAGAYTAQITSSLPLAAIVNEVAAPSSGPARQSTSYNTVSTGGSASHLALVENAGPDGWTTGEGIMNTGSSPTTVTVTYYDATTGAPVGTPPAPQNLNPRAFMPIYQGDATGGVLPAGTRATAVITTSGGQVAVICNESNPTTFMSYGGQ